MIAFKHRTWILSLIAGFTALVFGFASAAQAAEPRSLGKHGDWEAYVFLEGGNKVCYMASKPSDARGDYTRRGDIFALITHRPADGTRNVFSYVTGYPYQAGSDATLTIDNNQRITLFTEGETAWAADAATDNRIAEQIRRGSRMVVRGTSSRGTQTTDTFSLRGSGAAHDAISRECGIR